MKEEGIVGGRCKMKEEEGIGVRVGEARLYPYFSKVTGSLKDVLRRLRAFV